MIQMLPSSVGPNARHIFLMGRVSQPLRSNTVHLRAEHQTRGVSPQTQLGLKITKLHDLTKVTQRWRAASVSSKFDRMRKSACGSKATEISDTMRQPHSTSAVRTRCAALQADTPCEPSREQSSSRTEQEGTLSETILLEPQQGYVNYTFGCSCM